MTRSVHISNRVVAAELAGERADHRYIHARGRRRRRLSSPPPARREMAAVRGDHIGVNISDDRRAAELFAQPMSERPVDRCVLPPGSHRRRPGRDPLRLAEQVALRQRRRLEHHRGDRRDVISPLPHHDRVENLDVVDALDAGGELELQLGHDRRLFLKAAISGQIKRAGGRVTRPRLPLRRGLLASVKRSFQTQRLQRIRELPFSPVSTTAAPTDAGTTGRETGRKHRYQALGSSSDAHLSSHDRFNPSTPAAPPPMGAANPPGATLALRCAGDGSRPRPLSPREALVGRIA